MAVAGRGEENREMIGAGPGKKRALSAQPTGDDCIHLFLRKRAPGLWFLNLRFICLILILSHVIQMLFCIDLSSKIEHWGQLREESMDWWGLAQGRISSSAE